MSTKKRKLDKEGENEEEEEIKDRKKCYCGKLAPTKQNIVYIESKRKLSLELNARSLKCKECGMWVHLSCVKTEMQQIPLSGDYCYHFLCFDCTKKINDQVNCDTFTLSTKKWSDVTIIALYNVWLKNMIEKYEGDVIIGRTEKKCYFKIHEILDFIDKNWKILCTGRDRTKTWVKKKKRIKRKKKLNFFRFSKHF